MEGFVVDQVSKTYMDEKQRPFQGYPAQGQLQNHR